MIYAHLSKDHKQAAVDSLLQRVDTIGTLTPEKCFEAPAEEFVTA